MHLFICLKAICISLFTISFYPMNNFPLDYCLSFHFAYGNFAHAEVFCLLFFFLCTWISQLHMAFSKVIKEFFNVSFFPTIFLVSFMYYEISMQKGVKFKKISSFFGNACWYSSLLSNDLVKNEKESLCVCVHLWVHKT